MKIISTKETVNAVLLRSVILAPLTVILTIFALRHGAQMVKIATLPGLGWYRWVLVSGGLAFVAMLLWLWYRLILTIRLSHKNLSRKV